MTESEFYQQKVKPWLKKQGGFFYRIDFDRVPDVYTCKAGGVTWYELKVLDKIPKSGIVKPPWRTGQLSWIEEHNTKGGERTEIKLMLWMVNGWYILPPKKEYLMEELSEKRR
jgi:hypothetical protein